MLNLAENMLPKHGQNADGSWDVVEQHEPTAQVLFNGALSTVGDTVTAIFACENCKGKMIAWSLVGVNTPDVTLKLELSDDGGLNWYPAKVRTGADTNLELWKKTELAGTADSPIKGCVDVSDISASAMRVVINLSANGLTADSKIVAWGYTK